MQGRRYQGDEVVRGGGGGVAPGESNWVVWGYIDFRTLTPQTLTADATVGGIDFTKLGVANLVIDATRGLYHAAGGGAWALDLNTLPNRGDGAAADLTAYREVAFISEGSDGFGAYQERIGNWTGGSAGDQAQFLRNTSTIAPRVFRITGGASNRSGLAMSDGAATPFKRRAVRIEGLNATLYWDSVAVDTDPLPLSLDNIANIGPSTGLPIEAAVGDDGKGRGPVFDGSSNDQWQFSDDNNQNWDVYTLTILARG